MHSHHSHSGQFCRHAAPGTTLEDVVLAAIDAGFTTYGLSEHVPRYRKEDLYPEEEDLSPSDLLATFIHYLHEAHRLKLKYSAKIDLLVGLETDYITPLDITQLERLLSDKQTAGLVEYVVGSVHHVAEQGIDFSKDWWEACIGSFSTHDNGSTPPPPPSQTQAFTNDLGLPFPPAAVTAYLHAYLDAQHTLITRTHPTIIGHFDLCRLYIPQLPLNHPSLPGVWEKVVRNIREVVAYGGMFEVSAASFRKGWQEGYPGSEVLQCIIANKGRLCLSDDSHGPAFVALNYTRLRAYLLAQGVTELWYLASNTQENNNDSNSNSQVRGHDGSSRSVTGTIAQEGTEDTRSERSWLDLQQRKLTARRYDGNWADDPFWTRLAERERRNNAEMAT